MHFDPKIETDSVTREVRTGRSGADTTRVLVARRTYATDQSNLWDALTQPGRISSWRDPVSGDLREGGHYEANYVEKGVIEQCTAPVSFVVTREYPRYVSWVRVTLAPREDGTELEVSEEKVFDLEEWGQFGPCRDGVVWDLTLMQLGMYLSSGVAVNQDDFEDFSDTPQGRDFLRYSTEAWAAAAHANGDDSQAAINSAERTFRSFTELPVFDDDDEDF